MPGSMRSGASKFGLVLRQACIMSFLFICLLFRLLRLHHYHRRLAALNCVNRKAHVRSSRGRSRSQPAPTQRPAHCPAGSLYAACRGGSRESRQASKASSTASR